MFTRQNILSLFIPNSYQMYWDISLEGLSKKMVSEHDKFWSKKNREQKAVESGLTKNEVYALASIVEKESQYGPERPIIAGLYLNRIKITNSYIMCCYKRNQARYLPKDKKTIMWA